MPAHFLVKHIHTFPLVLFQTEGRVNQGFTFMKTLRLSSIPRIPIFYLSIPWPKGDPIQACIWQTTKCQLQGGPHFPKLVLFPLLKRPTALSLKGKKNIKMLYFFPRIYKLVSLFSQNKNVSRWIQDIPFKISITLKSNFHCHWVARGNALGSVSC